MQSIMADDRQGPGSHHDETQQRADERATRSRNVRTALILLSIAAVFFFGVIINRILAG